MKLLKCPITNLCTASETPCRAPHKIKRIEALIRASINFTNNEYPAFRDISTKIADYRRDGYTEDPNRLLLDDIGRMSMDDIARFYRSHVQGRTLVYVIVGNSRKIDMRRLAAFGNVIRIKKKDFYR